MTRDKIFSSMTINTGVTPMMQQYMSVKEAHQDFLLFYRMGDFYELFFEDAIIAARDLEIVLTKRGQHMGQDIPMCGVPVHARDIYLHKLIKKGHSVAICEQVETPQDAKKRGYKAVVRREVTRIITPGTLLEDALLDAKEPNYICCLHAHNNKTFISYAEISLGTWKLITIDDANLDTEIARLKPSEIIACTKLAQKCDLHTKYRNVRITTVAENMYDFHRTRAKLCTFYNTDFFNIAENFSKDEIIVLGVMLEYLTYTQKANMPKLHAPQKSSVNDYIIVDSSTRKNLELVKNINGEKTGSLLDVLDMTKTACGGRLLLHYISHPLTDPDAINVRLDSTDAMLKALPLCDALQSILQQFPDLERALTRISADKSNYADLVIVRNAMNIGIHVGEKLLNSMSLLSVELLITLKQIGGFGHVFDLLKMALNINQCNEKIDNSMQQHGPIKSGYNAQLDKLYALKYNSNNMLNEMRDKYRRITGINTLKITRNNIFGYFIEVTSINAEKMTNPAFKHKQSLGTVTRYVTQELQHLEAELTLCDEKITQLEDEIFTTLCNEVQKNHDRLILLAQSIAKIDVICSFATVAASNNYTKPLVDASVCLEIIDGRHPVLERRLAEHNTNLDDYTTNNGSHNFHSNSCTMNEDKNLWLITGPNMAGKSTFLRQNALICIMAQMGSFVPAKSARIGVIDKIFSRIGAGDNISQRQSTFMVEMLETSNILNNATRHSLLILDEIGRGTSTHDGLAIAWAVLEWINSRIEARTIFATHFHELTQLEQQLKHVVCYTVLVQEWHNKIIFMHKIIPGKTNKSYGIHVAELAGIPKEVTDRAYVILDNLLSNKPPA